jgi:inward rectifier potassium channel
LSQTSPTREIDRDLGLGARVAQKRPRRFLNRDGRFNVRREGLDFFRSLSLYHALLTITWPRFFLATGGAYLVYNALFAGAYFLCGPGALAGGTAQTAAERFAECFFFSVQTAATIGYGHLAPRGLPANLLMTVESFFGLLGLALATGILFSRFARPQAAIAFSQQAVVAPYRGVSGLMFRIANERRSELLEVQATVSLSWLAPGVAGHPRQFHELALERQKIAFFPLHWVVVHPIDETSPLWGMSRETFMEADAEIYVLLTAVDETFEQTVHSRSSYKFSEVAWGARFGDMFLELPDGMIGSDLRRLHDVEPAPLPPPGTRAQPAP